MKSLAFVKLLDTADDEPVWVRPEDIRQVAKRDKGETIVGLASGEVAWYPMGRDKFVKWLTKVEG